MHDTCADAGDTTIPRIIPLFLLPLLGVCPRLALSLAHPSDGGHITRALEWQAITGTKPVWYLQEELLEHQKGKVCLHACGPLSCIAREHGCACVRDGLAWASRCLTYLIASYRMRVRLILYLCACGASWQADADIKARKALTKGLKKDDK